MSEKCPYCKKPLELIITVTDGDNILWNSKEKRYEKDDAQIQLTYHCGECRKPIGGWRADGEEWGFLPNLQ